MSWEISISGDGWGEIYEKCHRMRLAAMAKAIGDYNYEIFHGTWDKKGNPHHKGAWNWRKLMKYGRECLGNMIYDCIVETNTCDNGGYKYWIDPNGYHKVVLKETE